MTTIHGGELLAGRWQLGEPIGRGAVAVVHDAVDATTGDRVAVKVLRHADADQRARFAREVVALESLDHPGVVQVLGHGELDGCPFLVLERIAGGSLADRIARGPLPEAEVVAIGATLADALVHAHERGVVHRDVKPSNVLLDDGGAPRLADFGVAQLDGAGSLTATGFTVGTAGYLAPEQVRGEAVGPEADVYSLGLLLLEALTGERAYPGTGVRAAMARLERPPAIPPPVPVHLADRIRVMTAMAPGDRPPMPAVAADLRALSSPADDGGTAVLPIVGDPTVAVPVVPAGAAPSGDARPAAVVANRAWPWRRMAFAAGCFLVGFLLVLAVRAEDPSLDGPAPTTTTPTTVAATVPTTAAPLTTAPPPPPAADEDDGEEGEGGGNRGNGRGKRDDD